MEGALRDLECRRAPSYSPDEAPPEDEEISAEEEAVVAEDRAEVARGDVLDAEEVWGALDER